MVRTSSAYWGQVEPTSLESTGIGEDGARPGHEAVQAAEIADQLVTGSQIKMIGVGEQNRGIEVLGEVALGEPFDRGLRADGHEHGRFDIAVSGMQHTGAGACDRTLGLNLEGDLRPELHLK